MSLDQATVYKCGAGSLTYDLGNLQTFTGNVGGATAPAVSYFSLSLCM